MTTYKDAGVDIEAGDLAVKEISSIVKQSFTKNTLTNIGGFGGCFNFPKNDYDEPVLVSSADGVGTKLKIAFLTGKHNTIGQCLVNHCVNDILAIGARPLFFLDYFATGILDINILKNVVSGLSIACQENKCSLIGGETAEMPDFYKDDEYDISGTIVGVVDKKYMLSNRAKNSGDILIGLPSTGLHTNGYSLARKVLLNKFGIDEHIDSLNSSISDSLLKVHKSYLDIISPILEKKWLKGLSHITGGGIVNNTNRILHRNQSLDIDWNSWNIPPIFKLIEECGNVPFDDMKQSMNLGIGLVMIISKAEIEKCIEYLESIDENYFIIGKVL